MKAATVVVSLAVAGLATVHFTCAWSLFFTPDARAFIALKNRTALPAPTDFDPHVTLDAMLARGDDRHRFLSSRAATVEGYVVAVFEAGSEAANCFSLSRRDTHIELALRADAAPRERVTVEVTPPLRDWAAAQGIDWSSAALARDFLNRRVRVSGWLLFDREHDGESENTSPGDDENWRATAWEIHPVTAIAVIATP